MAVGIVDGHGRTGTRDCSDIREYRDCRPKIVQLKSQPEATGRAAAVWVEVEDSAADPSRVVLWTGAVLLGYQSQPHGFVKPPRALQIGTASTTSVSPRAFVTGA